MRVVFRKPGTVLAALPNKNSLDVNLSSRWRLANEQTLRLRPPAFLEAPESQRPVLLERFRLSQLDVPELYGYVVRDVSSVGENFVVFKDGTFIDSTLIDAEEPVRQVSDLIPLQEHTYESKWLDEDGPRIEAPTVFLGSAGVDMYHHWLFDAVTKVAVMDPQTYPELCYAVPDSVPVRMLGWLEAFGIEERRVIRTRVDVRTQFDCMILLPRLATTDVVLPHVLRKLRSVAETLDVSSSTSYDRIFVGRSDAPTSFRQLLNEREIAHEFTKLGYVTFTPGDWPPFEQARIFAKAERIVAVHGSGAANVLFSAKEARVMHLQPVDASYFTQHGMVSALRHQMFGYVFGETFARDTRFHNVEWVVDWDVVRRAIRRYDF